MPSFTFGTSTIEYTIQYKPLKHDCTIAIDWSTGVSIVAPEGVSQERVDDVLRRKAPWILRRLAEFREIKAPSTRHLFLSGEKFPYLGRNYRLKVQAGDVREVSLAFKNGRFFALVPHESSSIWREERLRSAFHNWYIAHGHDKLQRRVQLFGNRLGVHPAKVVVKNQQARWGSCTKSGTVNFNWHILMAPLRIVDYVVVHELSHMLYSDHSAEFWTTMQSVIPDYDERKEWLRVHGPTLQL